MRKGGRSMTVKTVNDRNALNTHVRAVKPVSYTHLTLPTTYSV